MTLLTALILHIRLLFDTHHTNSRAEVMTSQLHQMT